MKLLKEYMAFVTRYSRERLVDWQLADIEGVLSRRFGFLIWPSGFGKTMTASLVIAAHLIVSRVRITSLGAAGDEDQSLLLQAALDEIFTHPDLDRLVERTRTTIKLRHHPKSTHRTLATHPSSTWGVTPDIVIVDEVAEASPVMEKMIHALVSSLRKRQGSRLLLITSPGDVDSFAKRLLDEVRDDERWFISERTEDTVAHWLDTKNADLYDRMLPPEIVQSKHKGLWATPGGSVLDRAAVENIFTPDPPEGAGPREGGVDLALSRASGAVAVLRLTEGIVVVDVLIEYRPPRGGRIDLEEIESEIAALDRRLNVPFHFDIYQGALMMQRLGKMGVRCQEFTFSHANRTALFSRLLDTIERGRLRCRPHREFRQQLLSLSARRLPGSGLWRIDHRASARDDLLIAIGLGLQALPPLDGYGEVPPMGVGSRASGGLRHGDWVDAPLPDWTRMPSTYGDW